jgi:hypothetical protein
VWAPTKRNAGALRCRDIYCKPMLPKDALKRRGTMVHLSNRRWGHVGVESVPPAPITARVIEITSQLWRSHASQGHLEHRRLLMPFANRAEEATTEELFKGL